MPDLTGHCSVCGRPCPATPEGVRDGLVTLIDHLHPKPGLGKCIGSGMRVRPVPNA